MSRRPKLSLSPDNKVDKTQAKGFGTETPTSPDHKTATQNPAHNSPEPAEPDTPPQKDSDTISQATAWPSRKRLVKIVLVVVAAALSLYLLKRRLM